MTSGVVSKQADQQVGLWLLLGCVLLALGVYRSAELWWGTSGETLVAVPALYALMVAAAAVLVFVLWVRAEVFEQPWLHWLAAGFAVAGTAALLQAVTIVGANNDSRLTATGAAGLYLVWHAALPLFVLGGLLVPDRRGLRRATVMVMALLLAAGVTDPAWLPLPALVGEMGEFTLVYRMLVVVVLAALIAVTGLWLVRAGRRPTRVEAWISVALLLASLDMLAGTLAAGFLDAAWWSSATLRTAQFALPAGALLTDQGQLLRLLRNHERGLVEQYEAELALTANVTTPHRQDPDSARRIEGALAGRTFHPVFQPIYRLDDGQLSAVEALTRFEPEPNRTPDVWFAEAAAVGLGVDLEVAAIAAALDASTGLPADVALTVNASPATVASAELLTLIDRRPGRLLVVEVTEHAIVNDYGQLAAALLALRSRGVLVAVDDAGAGFASLRHIVRLRPDIIKLDISLTHGIHFDPVRRSLADCLIRFATETGAELVAEGLEQEADLTIWRELGAHAAQGYLFGRPGPLPVPVRCPELVEVGRTEKLAAGLRVA